MIESVFIEDNSSLTIKGAKKMCSSTPNQSVVETANSSIIISGANLEVKKLDLENGEVSLAGKVNNVKFASLSGAKTPLIKRIFK